MRIRNYLLHAAAVALIALSMAARADIVWDFSYTGPGASGAGQFITGDVGSPFSLIGITGMANGFTITGLSTFAGADNLLYSPPSPGFVDFGGISFTTSGGPDFNLFYDGGHFAMDSNESPGGGAVYEHPISLDVTIAVPEPATLALLGLGLAGLGLSRRKNA